MNENNTNGISDRTNTILNWLFYPTALLAVTIALMVWLSPNHLESQRGTEIRNIDSNSKIINEYGFNDSRSDTLDKWLFNDSDSHYRILFKEGIGCGEGFERANSRDAY